MSALADRIELELASPAPDAVIALARSLADAERDAAVLYYGSTLRTGDLSGVLDFYRLTTGPHPMRWIRQQLADQLKGANNEL